MIYTNLHRLPNVSIGTQWFPEGDFYYPDPVMVKFWDSELEVFKQNPDANIADIPDHMLYHKDYVENQPTWFEPVI